MKVNEKTTLFYKKNYTFMRKSKFFYEKISIKIYELKIYFLWRWNKSFIKKIQFLWMENKVFMKLFGGWLHEVLSKFNADCLAEYQEAYYVFRYVHYLPFILPIN